MRNGPAFALLCITFAFGLGCPASAQDAAPHLGARTADGQTTYYIGQRIPLALSFTGPDNKRFQINMAGYDRSGRMWEEKFEVSPGAGWADPLETYFGSSMGYIGGGLTGFRALSPEPIAINLDLNEWVGFDQPGSYTITVESQRVTDVTQKTPAGFAPEPVRLRSDPIRVHIAPAPEAWQRAKLAQIVTELKVQNPKPGMPPPALKEATADLRFLGTPAAARIMAQHVREDEPELMYQCAFGLMGLPENVRPAALAAMTKMMDAPHFPVSGWFLTAMSVLQLTSSDPSRNAKSVRN